ncbi:endonuclease/exonuclease/phosphatase family protein [uncultured Adlercreutzia sp.]|uniref:endonuclease/exonuclease/phosphatase family protein n=1 Tax=uncultured Adlercreutzia sp. TaxID=875803 RepID=UPI0025CFB48C|nr:endonuclease/exonuclease/phosphatase family protein [uncultured Adlercreutzia sp.]MCI9261432.1 endonuclease/exonuclease/phosphatase family protein [Eggerthellaceae bacterium]
MASKVLKIIVGIVAALIVAVLVYVGYVMFSYNRLDDALPLEAEPPANGAALHEAVAVDSTADLIIATANLGFGAYNSAFDFFMDGGTGSVAASEQVVRDDINGSAEALNALNPSFLLLQEVDVDGTRSHHVDEYALLRDDFPAFASVFAQNYDSAFLAWPLYAPHGANRAGLVTFSRYTVTDALRRSLPISEGFSKFLDLDRCYSISRIPCSNGKELVLFNVHLSAYGADESIMAAQRSMLYEDMVRERAAGNYVIAGGDYNHDMIGVSGEVYGNQVEAVESWAKPYDFAGVPEGFTVGCKAKLDEEGLAAFDDAATCRDAGRPYDGTNDRWIMDAFIYSDNVECLDYETLDLNFAYSDHNPVVMKFRLQA